MALAGEIKPMPKNMEKKKFSDLHYREDISLENNDDSDSAATNDED